MRVVLSDAYGFCGGVRDAVRRAHEAIREARETGLPCYVYGDIVHSKAVMEELLAEGAERIVSPDGHLPGIVVIRAHGITDGMRSSFTMAGFTVIDATCPVVLKSQRLLRDSGRRTIIIGMRGHSEILTLQGSGRESYLVESPDDLSAIPVGIAYDAVVQTTFSLPVLQMIKEKAMQLGLEIRYLNGICPASSERRKALASLAGRVEAIVVAGDSASRNTVELWQEGKRLGLPCFLVSSVDGIPDEVLAFSCVGLTAGASCPDTLVEGIRRRLADGR